MTNSEAKAALIRLMTRNLRGRIMWIVSQIGLAAVALWLAYMSFTDQMNGVGFAIIMGTIVVSNMVCNSQYEKLKLMFSKYEEHMEKLGHG